MSLAVLSVAFPMAAVNADSTGGAEQILLEIDRGLVRRGHRSLVIACDGSRVQGTLVATRAVKGRIKNETWHEAHEAVRSALRGALQRYPVDVVHMHGVDYAEYLPQGPVPVLATLHLPLSWYKHSALHPTRQRTYLNCVSRSQRRLADVAGNSAGAFVPEIENGVRTDLLKPNAGGVKREFALCLGRICPEKGFHIALRAARRAGWEMLLGGQVTCFPEHEAYFAREILPLLDARRRYIGPLGFESKSRLLAEARCVVVPSEVPETSSLVAREALACGTPVIAFARGALEEIVEDGKTGFLVENEEQLANAMQATPQLRPADCRRVAEERFSAEKMVERYIAVYQRLAEGAWPLSEVA